MCLEALASNGKLGGLLHVEHWFGASVDQCHGGLSMRLLFAQPPRDVAVGGFAR